MASLLQPPHPKERRIIFGNISKPGYAPDIETYLAHGGYESLKKAITMKPGEIIDMVKAANLRGRGGAGFPAGAKWSFIKYDDGKDHYIVVNGDESEPGTFKDRYILHEDPHQLIEGLAIAAFATNVHLSYIYIRCEFPKAAKIVWNAIKEARAKGFLGKNILGSGFDLDIYVHQGAGAYICGEETSLLESLEGKRPYPRIKPPYFPAVLGLYMKPTIVNNVETICHVKHIIAMGPEEYAKMGTPGDGGTRTMCVSGDVVRPGFYELPCGAVTLGELIHDICGGLKPGRTLKAVIPGGSSAKVQGQGSGWPDDRQGHPAPRLDDGCLHASSRWNDGGKWRRDDHGRHARHGLGPEQPEPILRPRKLRPVHPVPRRQPLDVQSYDSHHRPRRTPRRCEEPQKHRRQHRWPNHLCLR